MRVVAPGVVGLKARMEALLLMISNKVTLLLLKYDSYVRQNTTINQDYNKIKGGGGGGGGDDDDDGGGGGNGGDYFIMRCIIW
jgi:hypothetical protein